MRFQSTIYLLLQEQASVALLLRRRAQASYSPPISPTSLPTSKGAHLPFVGPQAWATQYVA